MDLSPHVYLPWHFLVVNNNNKPNPINVQNMHCVICHYVPHMHSSNKTIKKQKGVIT